MAAATSIAHITDGLAGPDFSQTLTRDEAIRRIKTALNQRSATRWSVTGGRGTAWGWIHICPRKQHSSLTDEESAELSELLGMDRKAHFQGESIPASLKYYAEYVDRAEGRTPRIHGEVYWD